MSIVIHEFHFPEVELFLSAAVQLFFWNIPTPTSINNLRKEFVEVCKRARNIWVQYQISVQFIGFKNLWKHSRFRICNLGLREIIEFDNFRWMRWNWCYTIGKSSLIATLPPAKPSENWRHVQKKIRFPSEFCPLCKCEMLCNDASLVEVKVPILRSMSTRKAFGSCQDANFLRIWRWLSSDWDSLALRSIYLWKNTTNTFHTHLKDMYRSTVKIHTPPTLSHMICVTVAHNHHN